MLSAKMPRGSLSDVAFIKGGIVEGNAEGMKTFANLFGGKSDDRSGVQATAQENTDGHITDEMPLDLFDRAIPDNRARVAAVKSIEAELNIPVFGFVNTTVSPE